MADMTFDGIQIDVWTKLIRTSGQHVMWRKCKYRQEGTLEHHDKFRN
jgi:hypothetical protein